MPRIEYDCRECMNCDTCNKKPKSFTFTAIAGGSTCFEATEYFAEAERNKE